MIVIKQNNRMSFEFGEFGKSADGGNMEDIMNKMEDIDWDNFNAPNDEEEADMSASDVFNQQKRSEPRQSDSRCFDNSREIMEISAINGMYSSQGSFRFEHEDSKLEHNTNIRYSKLQYLLQHAKKDSPANFFNNLQREKAAYRDEEEKFQGYPDFKHYIQNLKSDKRQKQQMLSAKLAVERDSRKDKMMNFFGSQEQQKNFTKKPVGENFLPQEFSDEDFFKSDNNSEKNQNNPASKYQNFYVGQKLPDFIPDHSEQEDADRFFDFQPKIKNKDKKESNSQANLDPIREERYNSFQKTFQQEKLGNLLSNYKTMKKNFQELMYELKSTNQGQQKIVEELKKLKQSRHQHETEEEKKEKLNRRLKSSEEKHKKLDDIRDQISRIGNNDKDIMYLKINEKIQHLESIVKVALEEIQEQKEAKLIKNRIVNYNSREVQENSQNASSKSSKFSQRPDQQQFEKPFKSPSRQFQNMNENSRQSQRGNKNDLRQQPNDSVHREKDSSSQNFQQSRAKNNDYFSPLDLHLDSVLQQGPQFLQQNFTPANFGTNYLPKEMQVETRNLKASLTQKSSLIYESFDFHISGRFTIADDDIHPVIAYIRVGNKCSIDLMDIHVIVYGPQGPSIITDPNQIFLQKMKKSSNFSFQVFINKNCLDDHCFSIQISYKTDSMSKKKMNFKVPLPILQLLKPEFVYQDKFRSDWNSLTNELFVKPKRLDFSQLRSHEDIKLSLPFIDLSQNDPDVFSYGLAFRYPKHDNLYYVKMLCYVNGKASLQIRSQKLGQNKFKQYLLDVLNFVFFALS